MRPFPHLLVDQEFVQAINAIEPKRTHRSLIIFGPPSTQINEFYAVKWKLKMFFLLIALTRHWYCVVLRYICHHTPKRFDQWKIQIREKNGGLCANFACNKWSLRKFCVLCKCKEVLVWGKLHESGFWYSCTPISLTLFIHKVLLCDRWNMKLWWYKSLTHIVTSDLAFGL